MRGVILHGPGDVRVEERADPRIEDPTDAVIRVVAACVCGSDLWPRSVVVVGDGAVGLMGVLAAREMGGETGTVASSGTTP